MNGCAYGDSSLENERLMTRTLAIGKGANCLGAFIFICNEHIVETLMAKGLEEPFAINMVKRLARPLLCELSLHVRSWQLL